MKIGTVLVVGAASLPAAVATWVVASRTVGALFAGEPAVITTPDLATPANIGSVQWFWALNGPVSADAGGDLSVDAEGNVRVAPIGNGELIATVSNDGSYTDDSPRDRVSPPFRYRVCEVGSTTCSATWERRR